MHKAMRIKGLVVVAVSSLMIGTLLGGFAVSSPVLAEYSGLFGLWESAEIIEGYEISVGLDALGKPRSLKPYEEIRTELLVPQHYGNLVEITGNGTASIFWYQDGNGVIRNAVVPDAAVHAVRIKLQNTRKLEFNVSRD
ncbi:MAG: hypothetical protein OSB12_09465 [Planctomycetota bacterium]|jgi:hypothetical protein|nr:hypothetical protein [Planctomycetota bacterium]